MKSRGSSRPASFGPHCDTGRPLVQKKRDWAPLAPSVWLRNQPSMFEQTLGTPGAQSPFSCQGLMAGETKAVCRPGFPARRGGGLGEIFDVPRSEGGPPPTRIPSPDRLSEHSVENLPESDDQSNEPEPTKRMRMAQIRNDTPQTKGNVRTLPRRNCPYHLQQ